MGGRSVKVLTVTVFECLKLERDGSVYVDTLETGPRHDQ